MLPRDFRLTLWARINLTHELALDLATVSGRISVRTYIVRTKTARKENIEKAVAVGSIIGESKPIMIYLDEVNSPGGSYLPITPKKLGNIMFEFGEISQTGDKIPELYYNEALDNYIKAGDSYKSVQLMLMGIFPLYVDHLLKWIIFGTNINHQSDLQAPIIGLVSELCELNETELLEVADLDTDEKLYKYHILSAKAHNSVQDASLNYKTEYLQHNHKRTKRKAKC